MAVTSPSLPTSLLVNQDLQPTEVEQRNWTFWNYVTLWIGMAHNIPAYMMAGGFIWMRRKTPSFRALPLPISMWVKEIPHGR